MLTNQGRRSIASGKLAQFSGAENVFRLHFSKSPAWDYEAIERVPDDLFSVPTVIAYDGFNRFTSSKHSFPDHHEAYFCVLISMGGLLLAARNLSSSEVILSEITNFDWSVVVS